MAFVVGRYEALLTLISPCIKGHQCILFSITHTCLMLKTRLISHTGFISDTRLISHTGFISNTRLISHTGFISNIRLISHKCLNMS